MTPTFEYFRGTKSSATKETQFRYQMVNPCIRDSFTRLHLVQDITPLVA